MNQAELAQKLAGIARDYHEMDVANREAEVIHMDLDMTEIGTPVRIEGRSGTFIKVDFQYQLTLLTSDFPEEEEVTSYRQSIRMQESGAVSAVSEPVEIEDWK